MAPIHLCTSESTDFTHWRFDWDHYDAFRPVLPDALFKRIFNFHDQHNRSYNTAVDAGTGSGKVLLRWANRFDCIHAIDPNTQPLSKILAEIKDDHIHPHQGPAEDMSFLGDHSIQFLASSVSAHFYDRSIWIPEVARVLQKGGTLAFWSYAPIPHIRTPDSEASRLFKSHLRNCLPPDYAPPNEHTLGLLLGVDQDYDCFDLPPHWFENVTRICWNRPASFPPFRRRPGEAYESIDDPGFMARRMTVLQLHEYMHTLGDLERAWAKCGGTAAQQKIDETWRALEACFGGPTMEETVYWPFFLVLASRK